MLFHLEHNVNVLYIVSINIDVRILDVLWKIADEEKEQ